MPMPTLDGNMQPIFLGRTGFLSDGLLGSYQGLGNGSTNTSGLCFTGVWNQQEAKFEQCFLRVLNFLPAIIAAVILLGQVLGYAIEALKWRPAWTRKFVEEFPPVGLEVQNARLGGRRRWNIWAVNLVSISAAGVVLEAVRSVCIGLAALGGGSMMGVSWLVVVGIVVVKAPKTAPPSLLLPLGAQIFVQGVLLADAFEELAVMERGISIASLALSVLAVFVILLMPLRDPELPAKEVSKPFSEPTSYLRSPEDNMSVWQFMTVAWMAPLIRIGSKRQLEDEDVWQLGHEFQHQRLYQNFRLLKGTVIQRLLRANAIDLVILTSLGLVELVAQYSTPLLLQLLLAAMEDITASKRVAVTYAVVMFVVRLVAAQSGVFSLWFGRRCYERSRGEMITMLFEKTLGRKISFQEQEKKIVPENGDGNGVASNGTARKNTPSNWSRFWGRASALFKGTPAAAATKESASMGKILNLMRNDVYEVSQRFWEFQGLITKPLSAIFSVILVVRMLGWPSMIAVLALVLAQILNAALARMMIYYEKKRRAATDSKLQVITQFVEAIRHLRWYGWQGAWLKQILEAREKELKLRVMTSIWAVLIGFTNTLALELTPVVAFFAYTVIAGKPLRVDIAFPAMQLFSMMNAALRDLPNLIIVIINAWVAVDRIEDFMAEPDREEMNTEALIGDSLALQHASFAWPGVKSLVLKEANLSFPLGMTVICGEVASGKTALLQALLGELDMLSGQLIRPREPVGYCAQTPWLQSMSIRENILFSSQYEDKRYKDVLEACALTPDLAQLKGGDLSFIGENGIGLSGGQKARVALARAVYSRANILLLDDPLSALDQQTAESIVQKCFAGPLLQDRTVVLVTHRTDLVFGMADQVVKIEGGRATLLDHDADAYDSFQRVPSTHSADDIGLQAVEDKIVAAVPDTFIEDENRAHGGVKAAVYWEYIKAGKLHWWGFLVMVLAAWRFVATSEAWFLKVWGEAYDEQKSGIHSFVHADELIGINAWPVDDWPSPESNIKPWLLGFFFLAFGQSLFFIIAQTVMIVIVYTAAKRMFRDIMEKVAAATFRFYDVTPVGRLMNRMTSDISVIDGNISMQFQQVATLGISWVSAVVVVASVTPTFLAFCVVLTAVFVIIFFRFLPTSQSLRRLEMVSLTPLMSNFGALLNGLTTVRAFGAQSRFQDRVINVVDTFQKMDHFYWALQAWLMYRFDALSALSAFLLTMLALLTDVSPGLTAFVLFAANKFVNTTHGLCRQYGQLQMEFVSVERVVELLHLEQEPKGNVTPPAWWPSFSGDIVFDNVLIKYAPHLDPALAGVSFTVKGGSKTAIIGRTGSGKSTLALAILATVLPQDGSIEIDKISLAEVDKQLLRTRITFLAQDPVLFPGSMRQNLDPVSEKSDLDCEVVLRRVCERQGWSLDTRVEAGGCNLSQGQRQLVGLARAVLRRSAIIVLDEATASIDRETAMQIQQILHEEMKDSTVITIAHRLEAVRNADYCIVLGKGKILEQGPADAMLLSRMEDLAEIAESSEGGQ